MRGARLRRREFITLVGGAAAWPMLARAQQAIPVIGVIGAGERGGFADLLDATRLGLKDFGFVEGQNFEFEYAFAAGRFDELPKLASGSGGGGGRVNFFSWFVLGPPPKGPPPPFPTFFSPQGRPVNVRFFC